jgi:nitrogen fixation protein FixH
MNTSKRKRSAWPMAITAFFIIGAAFLSTFIVWASRQQDDLVSGNYYEGEIRYGEQLERLNRTQAFDDKTIIAYDDAQHGITIQLPAGREHAASGNIHLYRPSDASRDREIALNVDANGVQHIDARQLTGGLWKIRVLWNVGGAEYFCERPVVLPD